MKNVIKQVFKSLKIWEFSVSFYDKLNAISITQILHIVKYSFAPKKKNRFDFFIIWGNGIEYTSEIIDIIRSYEYIDIIMIKKISFTNIEDFVNSIYLSDVVPKEHIQTKTSYLLKSSPEVIFVLVKNFNPKEKFFGEGRFKHIQCENIVKIKQHIREKYNPRINGEINHNHVIHASDFVEQVEQILTYLKLPSLKTFNRYDNLEYFIPYYLDFKKYYELTVNIDDLKINVINKGLVKIQNSPHYKYVTGDEDEYKHYLAENFGNKLTSDHLPESYNQLIKNFNFNYSDEKKHMIIVKKINNNEFQILDGAHRACIIRSQNMALKIKVLCLEE